MLRRLPRSFPILLLAAATATAHAAELGEPRVSSHVGQPLAADIELTLLEDPATPVQVRLASPEVYNGAGIALPPALSTLNLSVMRRDGRQFLHATTLRPVDADHVHLYLELVDHGQRAVRLATLWLTPDPNPAPLAVAAAPAPAPAVVAPPAVTVHAERPAPAPVRMAARAAAEPVAPPVSTSAPPQVARVPAPAALAAPSLPLPLHASPKTKIAALHAAAPAACTQSSEAQACIGLGNKNAELRARIGQLEERVASLQASLGAERQAVEPAVPAPGREAPKPEAHEAGKPEAKAPDIKAPETEPPKAPETEPPQIKPPPPPPGPKPISSIKPLVPHKPTTAPEDDGLPVGMIGGAVALLAAIGGIAALLKARGRKPRNVDIPAAPGKLATLRQRFFSRNGNPGGVDPLAEQAVEPSLE